MPKLVLVPQTAEPRRLAIENAFRRWCGAPRLDDFERVLAVMPPPGQAPRPEDLEDWLRHPDDRVVVEALCRFPALVSRDRWSWVIRGAAANASFMEASWTWRLDRVWHAAEMHQPDVLREVERARISLELGLRCLGPRRTRLALAVFVASVFREGVALYSPHAAVVRELLGHPARPGLWRMVLANPHLDLREAVVSNAWLWLTHLPLGISAVRTIHPAPAKGATPEIHRALDVIEYDPQLERRRPEDLGPALTHGDAAARERRAALLCRLGGA